MSRNASSDDPATPDRPLRILHCLRAPVGGLFRHVRDLARAQAARGHTVGIVCDSTTGGEAAEAALAALEPVCRLGVSRLPIGRLPGLSDLAAVRAVGRLARATGAGILHGHGAKGGVCARLAVAPARRFYTPHGGSLHYSRRSPAGLMFLTAERVMLARTDGLIFESDYGRRTFAERVGTPRCAQRVIHNGLGADEFADVVVAPDAADLLFVGELRALKGVDDLLDALALLAGEGRRPRTLIVGSGAGGDRFAARAGALGLASRVTFAPAMPARAAFARGRIMVVPSRAESLPYIVLEAAAAGRPLIATRVGGIPEIFGPDADGLVAPGDARALAGAIGAALADPAPLAARTLRVRARVRAEFSLDGMCDAVLDFYVRAGADGTAARSSCWYSRAIDSIWLAGSRSRSQRSCDRRL